MAVFCWTVFGLQAQDASEIVRASRDRIDVQTITSRSRMLVKSKSGAVSERIFDQGVKNGPSGRNTVIVFHNDPAQPESIRGARFLTRENPGGPDNQWIYLPARGGEPSRIAKGDGEKSFLATDFSNDDISSADRKADLDNHALLREEELNGSACYVIQSTPKDTSYQYSKMIQWIDKQTKVTMKVELYNKGGVLVKLLEILKLQEVQGRLSIMSTRMTTLAENTSTTINIERIQYDSQVPDSMFTTNFLKTGRP